MDDSINLTGLLIFVVAYIGIALGRFPRLAIDRTGIALLGGMLMLVTGVITLEQAVWSIDYATIIILFGLMLLSAQFRLGGFYTMVTRRIGESSLKPGRFMLLLILLSGGLSAILSNDVICLALTPVIVDITLRRRWNPLPFLFALAAASNIGSGMTIIGNPQNMFIGQRAGLDFGLFLLWCAPPALLSLGLVHLWAIRRDPLAATSDGETHSRPVAQSEDSESTKLKKSPKLPNLPDIPEINSGYHAFNAWQTGKAVLLTLVLVALFFTPVPHALSVMGVASILLMSRRLVTGKFMELVDWPLLILFIGLFLLIEGFRTSGGMVLVGMWLGAAGIDFYDPAFLAATSVLLSNMVSNVPAVMLLMADWPAGATELAYLLSITSTFAGNLVLIGSIANLIVAEQARRLGILIRFSDHLRWTFLPALLSILISVAWWFAMMRLVA